MLDELEIREAFHCLLLAHLPPDYRSGGAGSVAPLRLKGGVNLRLFHGSPRYSEDIDFDLVAIRGPKFIEHLRRLLLTPGRFQRDLLALGIQSLDVSALDGGDGGFKQKLRLMVGGVGHHTKVEVSYSDETPAREAVPLLVPDGFRTRYRLPAVLAVASYPGPIALWQKVLALSRRQHPQTRDVYDLHHLRRHLAPEVVAAGEEAILGRMTRERIGSAMGAALEFTPKQFADQTAAFLPLTLREAANAGWGDLQAEIWAWLHALADRLVDAPPRVDNDGTVAPADGAMPVPPEEPSEVPEGGANESI